MYYNVLGFLLFMVSIFFFLSFASFPFCHFQLHVNCFIYLFIYFKFPSLVFCPFFFFFSFFVLFYAFHSVGFFFVSSFFFLVHSCVCIYIYIFQICYFFIYQGYESKFIQTKFSIPPLFYFQTKNYKGKLKNFLSSPYFLSSYFFTFPTKQTQRHKRETIVLTKKEKRNIKHGPKL